VDLEDEAISRAQYVTKNGDAKYPQEPIQVP